MPGPGNRFTSPSHGGLHANHGITVSVTVTVAGLIPSHSAGSGPGSGSGAPAGPGPTLPTELAPRL